MLLSKSDKFAPLITNKFKLLLLLLFFFYVFSGGVFVLLMSTNIVFGTLGKNNNTRVYKKLQNVHVLVNFSFKD